jgi:hypothetical protein
MLSLLWEMRIHGHDKKLRGISVVLKMEAAYGHAEAMARKPRFLR